MFEIYYVMMWIFFLKKSNNFLGFVIKFLTVYNFKCLEKKASVISGFWSFLALFLIFCKNLSL